MKCFYFNFLRSIRKKKSLTRLERQKDLYEKNERYVVRSQYNGQMGFMCLLKPKMYDVNGAHIFT